ncbi:hypothetical protein E8E11_006800 [Didymella keratinophila]|nr:hypothetical protein E8E11_006800 [Didymella keratinophila]
MDQVERLSTVSSLYGPGSVGCWLCILLSVFVTWTADPRSRVKDTITNDLIAALSYPAVAAVHMLHELRTSSESIRDILTSQSQDKQQLAAAIEAPLNVCETFSAVTLVLIGVSVGRRHTKRACSVIVIGILCFTTEFILMIGSFSTEPSALTFARPFFFNIAGAVVVITVIGVILLVVYLATLLLPTAPSDDAEQQKIHDAQTGQRARALQGFTFLGATIAIVLTVVNGIGTVLTTANQSLDLHLGEKLLFFLPKAPISLRDLDQAVQLAGGVITLCFSIYGAAKSILVELGKDELHLD